MNTEKLEFIGKIAVQYYNQVKLNPTQKDFDLWITGKGVEGIICIKINVINSRPLSRHIADELGINHQSPQVIWLTKNHEIKWHASHYDISTRNLSKKLNV